MENRREIAINHTQKMAEEYAEEIAESIRKTVIYDPEEIEEIKLRKPKNRTKIEVINNKIVEELFANKLFSRDYDKTAILNFANFTVPGGGFIRGVMAQEEALCHGSFLYNVLSDEGIEEKYYHENIMTNELYTNRILYSPNIRFFKEDTNETMRADVITCAAPNAKTAYWIPAEKVKSAMESRIDAILAVASKENIQNLFLGAFGCGEFGNNPEVVAEIFKEKLMGKYKNVFQYVAFVIPDNGVSPNYKVFKKKFKKRFWV